MAALNETLSVVKKKHGSCWSCKSTKQSNFGKRYVWNFSKVAGFSVGFESRLCKVQDVWVVSALLYEQYYGLQHVINKTACIVGRYVTCYGKGTGTCWRLCYSRDYLLFGRTYYGINGVIVNANPAIVSQGHLLTTMRNVGVARYHPLFRHRFALDFSVPSIPTSHHTPKWEEMWYSEKK